MYEKVNNLKLNISLIKENLLLLLQEFNPTSNQSALLNDCI